MLRIILLVAIGVMGWMIYTAEKPFPAGEQQTQPETKKQPVKEEILATSASDLRDYAARTDALLKKLKEADREGLIENDVEWGKFARSFQEEWVLLKKERLQPQEASILVAGVASALQTYFMTLASKAPREKKMETLDFINEAVKDRNAFIEKLP
jgi:hypothetical protein